MTSQPPVTNYKDSMVFLTKESEFLVGFYKEGQLPKNNRNNLSKEQIGTLLTELFPAHIEHAKFVLTEAQKSFLKHDAGEIDILLSQFPALEQALKDLSQKRQTGKIKRESFYGFVFHFQIMLQNIVEDLEAPEHHVIGNIGTRTMSFMKMSLESMGVPAPELSKPQINK